jgi:hypothetical protein
MLGSPQSCSATPASAPSPATRRSRRRDGRRRRSASRRRGYSNRRNLRGSSPTFGRLREDAFTCVKSAAMAGDEDRYVSLALVPLAST